MALTAAAHTAQRARAMGMTPEEFLAKYPQYRLRVVAEGQDGARVLNQGGHSSEDLQFASDALTELADHDELFRYPVSKSRSLRGAMAEVFPESSFVRDDTRQDERDESGADKRTLFRTEAGKNFHVYEHGDRVWIDVSRLHEGDAGSAIYAAVGNYAHNAG